MNLQALYQDELHRLQPPGSGAYHGKILGIANYAAKVDLPPDQVVEDIRRHTKPGTRQLGYMEIESAVKKAYQEAGSGFTPRPRPKPVVKDGKAALQKIINQGKISDEADLWEASPLRLWEEPKDDPALLLSTLYEPTDLVLIGERHDAGILGHTIRTTTEWINHFHNGGKTAPFIIINPLSGIPAKKKTGDGETYRGDGNIAAYKYCLIEFDGLDRESQIKFFSAVKLPIRALIDSGNKSIHALVDVQKLATVTTAEQWATEIKQNLYDRLLVPLGIDGACSNPARLSRLPGHYRTEKENYQRILWLSGREGRFVNV